jgi:hypothetical protein
VFPPFNDEIGKNNNSESTSSKMWPQDQHYQCVQDALPEIKTQRLIKKPSTRRTEGETTETEMPMYNTSTVYVKKSKQSIATH